MYFKPLVSMVDFYLGENIDGTASRNVYWILSSNPEGKSISFIQCNKIAIKTLMVCIMYCKQCPLQNCSSIEFSFLFKEDDSYDKTFSFLQKIKTLLCLEVSSIILI